jgi:hypothetical protein
MKTYIREYLTPNEAREFLTTAEIREQGAENFEVLYRDIWHKLCRSDSLCEVVSTRVWRILVGVEDAREHYRSQIRFGAHVVSALEHPYFAVVDSRTDG